MKHRDLRIGVTVYHSIFVFLGQGTLVEILAPKDFAGVARPHRYVIEWTHGKGQKHRKCQAGELTSTPNKEQIRTLKAVGLKMPEDVG